jgi:citrate lyase subunit beta/citryl-CoA lyase
MLARAAGRGADALIIDLEDAVAPAAKPAARQAAATYLAGARRDEGPQLWVRINPGAAGLVDLDAVVAPPLRGVCLAKAADAGQVAALADRLSRLEAERGIEPGRIAVSPLLETAAAVLRASDIAAAPRVARLQVGEADLKVDIGVDTGPDERELWWVRSLVVLASAAAGIEPPVGPVSTDFTDLDALRESTLALKRMGYRGRACIHPAQVPVVNEVFTPTAAEVERARALLARYDQATESGAGAFIDADGTMVDLAVVRAAQRTLDGLD